MHISSTSPTRAASWAVFTSAAFLLVACGDDDSPEPSAPSISSFVASATEVDAGSSVDLTWATANAASIRISASPGGLVTESMMASGMVTTGTIAETTTFTLEARSGAQVAQASVSVSVRAAPTITRLRASPDPVDFSAMVTIEWAATGADTVRITVDGTEAVNSTDASGSFSRVADRVEGFLVIMEATNGTGTTRRTLPVRVTAPAGTEVEPNDSPSGATRLDSMGLATARLDNQDVDYFEVTVVDGGWIRAETSDGQGGCAVDQEMELRDVGGTVLVTARIGVFARNAMGQPIGACRRIEPRLDRGARELTAGTYYLRVTQGMFEPPTGPYTIQVETGSGGCGNGIIESQEQCDDGNTADGDGCSSTCTVPTPATVTNTATRAVVLSGALPERGVTLVRIDASGPGTLVAEVGTPTLGDCTDPMRLVLLDSTFAPTGASEGIQLQGGLYPCGRIDPDREAMLSDIPSAGTFYLRAEAIDGTMPVAAHEFTVRLFDGASGCGNGYRESNELCDDANSVETDFCTRTCTLNPLNAADAQLTLPVGTSFDPFYRVRVQVGSRGSLTATVTSAGTSTVGNCGVPTRMGLARPTDMLSILGLSPAGQNCGGIVQPGAQYAADLPATNYDLLLFNGGTGPGASVTVRTRLIAAACGNGILEPSNAESCDDGNRVDNDGCRNDCTENSVLITESEPNNQRSEATPVAVTPGGAISVVSGRFANSTDVDVYRITLPANADFELQTYTRQGDRTSCTTVDTVVQVVDQTRELAVNDDRADLRNLCSRLVSRDVPGLQGLPAGDYFIVVQPFPNTPAGPYFLDVLVR